MSDLRCTECRWGVVANHGDRRRLSNLLFHTRASAREFAKSWNTEDDDIKAQVVQVQAVYRRSFAKVTQA